MIDLFLEDVGKLDWVKPVWTKAKAAIKFIKLHQKPAGLYRHLEHKSLLLPGTPSA